MSHDDLPTLSTLKPGEVDVWDLQGNYHRMSIPNASDVVTHLGWSRRAPFVVPAAPAAAPAPAPAPAAEAKPLTLAEMSREALAQIARDRYEMVFDDDVPREAILGAILAEQ